MKRICALFVFIAIALVSLTGCGSFLRMFEKQIYTEKLEAFFEALDKGDSQSIKALFSKTAIDSDLDLDEQIDKLISIYPRSSTKIIFDDLLAGEYTDEFGLSRSSVYATVPVVCDNEYYWVDFELIYEDDFNSDNVGVNSIYFYTADEYCLYFHDEDSEYPSDTGLVVIADRVLENEVVCISSYPYELASSEREINLSEAEEFIKENKDFTAFTERFGQPNTTCSVEEDLDWHDWHDWHYKTKDKKGKAVYLELFVVDGKVIGASLVDEFGHIETICKED